MINFIIHFTGYGITYSGCDKIYTVVIQGSPGLCYNQSTFHRPIHMFHPSYHVYRTLWVASYIIRVITHIVTNFAHQVYHCTVRTISIHAAQVLDGQYTTAASHKPHVVSNYQPSRLIFQQLVQDRNNGNIFAHYCLVKVNPVVQQSGALMIGLFKLPQAADQTIHVPVIWGILLGTMIKVNIPFSTILIIRIKVYFKQPFGVGY